MLLPCFEAGCELLDEPCLVNLALRQKTASAHSLPKAQAGVNSASFGKDFRLLKPADFKRVFEHRKSVHNAHFGIYVASNTDETENKQARLGLVVSKKVNKKAVVRNQIKRHIREFFRLQCHQFGAIDFVVVAKAPINTLENSEIRQQLQTLWSQALKRAK